MHINTRHTLLPDHAPVALSAAIDKEIKKSFKLDRYLGDTLTIPYKFDSIKIKSNELCVSDNINASFYKLYYNFLYLNAQTKVASNNIPQQYIGFIALAGNDGRIPTWYSSTTASSQLQVDLASKHTALSGVVDGVFTKSLGTDTGYVGFVANSTEIIALSSTVSDSHVNIPLSATNIEDATALTFNDIKSLVFDSEKRLFVLDGVNIYKFDVDAVLTQNPAIRNVGRFLLTTIGGTGTNIYEKDTFGNPISLRIGKHDKLYILDKKFKGFKIYDNNLNWISTAAKKVDFQSTNGTVVDLAVDTVTEYCYVLTDTGTVFEYDNNDKLVDTHTLDDRLMTDEAFKKMTFSKVDTDVLYVITNRNIFKKFKTKLSKSIGAFRLSDNEYIQNSAWSRESFTFINTLNIPGRSDDFIFAGAIAPHPSSGFAPMGKVFKFNESTLYQTIAYDTYKTSTYPLSAININEDEHVTSWVFNKALGKLIYNHVLFNDNIHSKYVGEYELSSGRPQYKGVNYITDSDTSLRNYTTTLDNYVGINEPLLAETINRPLNEIYKLQLKMLDMCTEKYSNKYPAATQVVGVS